MLNEKVGEVIYKLRKEQKMTQKQLADKMQLSDKTISKWERGLGLPDISFLSNLSDILGADIKSLLEGDSTQQDFVNGNMKKVKYYVCPQCHNISWCSGHATVSCCGKSLKEQIPKKASPEETLHVEVIDKDWYISTNHPMTKEHYISFVAFVTGDRISIIKQYPEWNLQIRIRKEGHPMLLWYCTLHGLRYQYL